MPKLIELTNQDIARVKLLYVQGQTQEQLAQEYNVDQSTISRLLRGTKKPTKETIIANMYRQGYSTEQIAKFVHLDVRTIQNYLSKTGLRKGASLPPQEVSLDRLHEEGLFRELAKAEGGTQHATFTGQRDSRSHDDDDSGTSGHLEGGPGSAPSRKKIGIELGDIAGGSSRAVKHYPKPSDKGSYTEFKCRHCGQLVKNDYEAMEAHFKENHKGVKGPVSDQYVYPKLNLKCIKCNHRFSSYPPLLQHARTSHPELYQEVIEAQERPALPPQSAAQKRWEETHPESARITPNNSPYDPNYPLYGGKRRTQ